MSPSGQLGKCPLQLEDNCVLSKKEGNKFARLTTEVTWEQSYRAQ